MSEHLGHEGHGASDPVGQRVGVLASLLAVSLTIVTIASHRAHTHSITLKAEANDQWAFYQSKKVKSHTLDLGLDLAAALGAKGDAAEKMIQKYEREKERYARESEPIKQKAEEHEKESRHEEVKAMRFDISEGIFEVALILASLYFVSRKKAFPFLSILAGIGAAVFGVMGMLA